ncbi:MAG: SAM-dependent methyltransferase, partial [Rhodospirillaceae bacterium]|nr:SAM-dependent methyltransferase [Rhodospirillaceae bacterium]
MAFVDFVGIVHKATTRDYVQRVVEHDKAECAEVAGQFGKDYWDGDRRYGFGGYYYDGRWRKVADAMIAHYGLTPGAKILDIGCGKGFLLYEFTQALEEA